MKNGWMDRLVCLLAFSVRLLKIVSNSQGIKNFKLKNILKIVAVLSWSEIQTDFQDMYKVQVKWFFFFANFLFSIWWNSTYYIGCFLYLGTFLI